MTPRAPQPRAPRPLRAPDAVALTSRLLHFCAAPSASVRDAERLLAGLEDPNDPAVAVAAVNVMRDIHALLADAAFPSLAAREQQRRALLDLSSKLVAAEEAQFAD
ncbi:MAG: hypothetical protein AAF318_01390 [Pseudomonadota bacterium]